MPKSLAKAGQTWKFSCPTPPREVFAVMEQMLGVPPYRFEAVDAQAARIVEVSRLGFFGQWKKSVVRPAWVTVTAVEGEDGTEVVVQSSVKPLSATRLTRLPGAPARALQLVQLLTRGRSDGRTVYRDRRIPVGPITLVASWAGTAYPLYTAPSFDAPRGENIFTATPLGAVEQRGSFVKVALGDGSTGWVERDQIVPAPARALREAGEATARAAGPPHSASR